MQIWITDKKLLQQHYPNVLRTSSTSGKQQSIADWIRFLSLKKNLYICLLVLNESANNVYTDDFTKKGGKRWNHDVLRGTTKYFLTLHGETIHDHKFIVKRMIEHSIRFGKPSLKLYHFVHMKTCADMISRSCYYKLKY